MQPGELIESLFDLYLSDMYWEDYNARLRALRGLYEDYSTATQGNTQSASFGPCQLLQAAWTVGTPAQAQYLCPPLCGGPERERDCPPQQGNCKHSVPGH